MKKKLSIIIPVYNESVYIIRSLENVINVPILNYEKEIIVVNDGSTDNTFELLKKFNHIHKKITIISYSKNIGKGGALKKGIEKATGDIVIIQDADLEYDPDDYLLILKEFENKEVNVVYGSRILGAKLYHNFNASFIFYLGGITLTKWINLLLGTKITDQPTCYKSWRSSLSRDLLLYCKSNGFEFEVEMTAFFSKKNTIVEVPIHYYPRTVEHGKKIGLNDGISSLLMILRCKLRR